MYLHIISLPSYVDNPLWNSAMFVVYSYLVIIKECPHTLRLKVTLNRKTQDTVVA